MSEPLARLVNVTKRYGSVVALDGFDFAVERGELVSVLGPNGAGKTTAIRLLLGLARPTKGEVRVLGGDPRIRASRMRIGAMLQIGKVPETLRVREHVELFSTYYPQPLPYSDIVDIAGLTEIQERRYGDLSGGQQQRVLFALAICGNPDVIFLDEPTVGLDVEARRSMWAMIRRLVDEGRSVLLTTHYLDEADHLADRIVILHEGKHLVEGTPSEIKRAVATKTVRCTTVVEGSTIESIPGVRTVRTHRGKLEVLVTEAEPVVRALLELDPNLSDLEVAEADLESAFIEWTSGAGGTSGASA